MFTVNTTPAIAATGTVTATMPVAATTPQGQSFTAKSAAAASTTRDSYSVTTPPPAAPRPTTPAQSATDPIAALPSSSMATVTASQTIQRPFPGLTTISSPFGFRSAPCAGCTSFHEGTDLTPGAGTPISAVASGTVAVSGWHSNYGQYVILDHLIDGRKISTLYGHMQAGSSPLRAGETVSAGTLVGLVGNTGISTGAHLHLEVRLDETLPVDPMTWLTAHGA